MIRTMKLGPNLDTASDIGQKGHFLKKKKKGHQKFHHHYSIPLQSDFHQNKTLHNFHKRGAVSNCWTHKRVRLGSGSTYLQVGFSFLR